jgi:hypothetical protein
MLLALGPSAVNAADENSDARHDGWQFEVTPYLWLPETHGTVHIGNLSADLDIGFDDVFDLLGDGDLIGGMGHFEARKGRAAMFVDAWGAVINTDADGKILRDRVDVEADIDFDIAAVEFGGAYRLLEHGRFIFEGLFGGRYTYVYSGIKVNAANRRRSEDGSADFFDPFPPLQ